MRPSRNRYDPRRAAGLDQHCGLGEVDGRADVARHQQQLLAARGALAQTAERQVLFEGLGLPGDIAGELAEAAGPEMGECILTLYRAAAQPFMKELGERLAAAERRPSLCLVAAEDPYVPADLAAEVAVA